MDILFRWIHLSDIHTGHGDRAYAWDQSLVLAAIVSDIRQQREKQPQPPIDAILVTGDIANTGAGRTPTEYDAAATWLGKVAAAAGVTPAQIFMVPGNHDVDRGADKDDAVKQLVTELREGKKSLDDALTDAAPRALLARRMAKYLDFAGGFAPVGATADARIHWVHRLVARSGLTVRLVGLNTTLLAAGDDDQGQLRVGKKQIGHAFVDVDVEDTELVLALGHHPLDGGWLFDQPQIEPWLKKHAHALLTGHVHVANAQQSYSGAGTSFLRLVAGSAHGDNVAGAPAGHGYSFGAIVRGDDGVARAQVMPRRWSEPNVMGFRPDVDNLPEGKTYSDHPLPRLRLSASLDKPSPAETSPAPSPVKLAAGRPIPAFISVAPGDDASRVELQNHLVQLRRSKKITFKHSREIPPGVEEAPWIAERIAEARIIFLLISQEYIGSDAYYEDQLLRAVERHSRGEVTIIPILLSPFRFADEPFAGLVFLPRRPVDGSRSFPDEPIVANRACPVNQYPGGRDKAFEGIAQEVRLTVERILAGAAKAT